MWWWLSFSKKKRLENKIKMLTKRLNNLDRINKGFRSEINETSAKIDITKNDIDKKKNGASLYEKRKEQTTLERRRFRLTRDLNKARNDLARLR